MDAVNRHSKYNEYNYFQVNDQLYNHMNEIIECYIGSKRISMLIYSGSQHNLLSKKDWKYLNKRRKKLWNIRTESENQLRAYPGNNLIRIKAVFEAVIGLDVVSNPISTFYVIENGGKSLLSRDTAIQLNDLKLGREIIKIKNLQIFPINNSLSIDNSIKPIQQPLRSVAAERLDVIVFGNSELEHNRNLEDVLATLKEYNVLLND